MKIINFKAENIKKLVAVEITPDGNVVKITGKNGAGKTSILDAIMYALGGTASVSKQPIRKGQQHALVELDLGDLIVERKFNQKEGDEYTSQLVVRNKEGAKFSSPQRMLDELVGRLSFDPLEFMRMKPAEQFEALRDLLGLDFSKLELERRALYDTRTDLGRQYREKKAQLEGIQFDPEGATVEESATAIMDEYQKAADANKVIINARDDVVRLERDIEQHEARIKEIQRQIEHDRALLEAKTKTAKQQLQDVDAIKRRLDELEANNRNARAFQQHQQLAAQVSDLEKQGKAKSAGIEAVDQKKADMIAAAKMPIEGLQFGDGYVLYNGVPIEQASAAEQLRVSLAMAMAMNPKLRVIRITDGSLLDGESMKVVEQLAANNDYQVWMELVDESGEVGVVIEDGMVKAAKTKAGKPAALPAGDSHAQPEGVAG